MRYDAYLAAGYPIASGVIEGACRHFVKDRMERSGMRWRIESAQAMLDVRSIYLNGDWDDFMTYRIEKETQRLYPYREFVEPIHTRTPLATATPAPAVRNHRNCLRCIRCALPPPRIFCGLRPIRCAIILLLSVISVIRAPQAIVTRVIMPPSMCIGLWQ